MEWARPFYRSIRATFRFWPFAVVTGAAGRVYLVTLCAALTIFLASWFFFARLRLKPIIALGSAWMTYAVTMLGTGEYIAGIDPLICSALNLICLGALVETGADTLAMTVAWGAVYVCGFVVLILAHPAWHLIGLPFLFIFAAAIIIASHSWREFIIKCVTVLSALVIAWVLGAYDFLLLLLSDTARLMFASKFQGFDHVPFLAGHLFRPDIEDILWSGLVIVGLAVAGALDVTFNTRLWRVISISGIAVYTIAAVVGVIFLLSDAPWPWPKPSYVLLSFYPVGALFSVIGIRMIYLAVADIGFRWRLRRSPWKLTAAGTCLTVFLLWHVVRDPINVRNLLITVVFLVAIGAMLWKGYVHMAALITVLGALIALYSHATDLMNGRGADRDGATRMAIKENPVTAFLKEHVGLTPGAMFRGYADDAYHHFQGMTLGGDLITQWSGNWQLYGSGMKLFTWNALGIPTISMYNPYIKPLYFAFFTGLLNWPGEQQEVNYLTISRPDVRILELAGVRYVVKDDDEELGQGARIVASWEKFRVYELLNPNLGSYTPTEAIAERSVDKAIAHLRDPEFDPTRQVLVDDPASVGSLVPGAPAQVVFERGGFHVTSQSAGRTLVVLPIEFTHCMIGSRTGRPSDAGKLIRVNLAQTGLLFENRVSMSIRYRDWPLASTKCRQLDYADSVRLIAPDNR